MTIIQYSSDRFIVTKMLCILSLKSLFSDEKLAIMSNSSNTAEQQPEQAEIEYTYLLTSNKTHILEWFSILYLYFSHTYDIKFIIIKNNRCIL